jgi:putative ABC transport system permease protein
MSDIGYAARSLRQRPGFALIAILALGLGIGATTAIFSVVDATLLRRLPYPQPERLVWVGITFPSLREEIMPGADYVEWKRQNHVFDGYAAFGSGSCDLTGSGEPERLTCGFVTQNFLQTLGVQPVLGRGFLDREDAPGGPKAVALTYGFWLRRFGADRSAIGRSVTIDGASNSIVGVLPRSFRFPGQTGVDVLIPQQLDEAAQLNRKTMRILRTIGRLKPGVSLTQAKAELETFLASARKRFGFFYRQDNQVRLVPVQEHEAGGMRLTLLAMLAAVGCVLLIACANVANLLLARAAGRRREIAVRAALGAGRARLARLLMTETLLLGLLGGGVGIVLAAVALRGMVRLAPTDLLRFGDASIDLRVLLFALAISLLTSIFFGLAPSVTSGQFHLTEDLKAGGGRPGTASGGRLRGGLVIAELALSMLLVTAAALLLQSLWRLQNVTLGFSPERVLATQISLKGARYRERPRKIEFWNQLLERVSGVPGVDAVALSTGLPPQGASSLQTFSRADAPPPEPGHRGDNVVIRAVSKGYFQAMGIPLHTGRLFDERDGEKAPRVAVVNESLARKYFAHENPLGKQIMGHVEHGWKTIAGIVADARNDGPNAPARPEMYQPFAQAGYIDSLALVVRGPSQPETLAPSVRDQVRALDRDLPLTFRTMEEQLATFSARPRFTTVLFGAFALVALVLAAVGTYGVLCYSVAQRTQEIGIRMALGAAPQQVLRGVFAQAFVLAAAGVGIGLAASLALTRYLASLLFEVKANDPFTFVSVAAVLVGTTLLATWLPARRATRVDPVIALRSE